MGLRLFAPGTRRGNRYWIARGTINGQEYEISTHETDEGLAQKEAAKRELEILASDGPQRREDKTFRQAALMYLDFRKPTMANERHINRLLLELGPKKLAEVRQHHIVAAANKLFPLGSNATKNRQAYVPAAAILHYAAENGDCEWRRIKKLKEPKPRPRHVSKSVATVLLANTEGHQRLLLVCLFRQGWRISDALGLEWKDIDLRRKAARLHTGKTDEWREYPLHDETLDALRLVLRKHRFGRVFSWGDRHNVYRWLRPLTKKLGIKFTPHMARHSFATWLVNQGAEMSELMEAGGWKDPKSVVRYGKASQERTREVINRVK